MTAKRKPALALVQPDLDQMEAVVVEAAKQMAPVIHRKEQHLNAVALSVRNLRREREEFEERRALLKTQWEAADEGLRQHIEDIDASLAVYTGGVGETAE